MNLKETLTKENFWNEIYAKYPNAYQLFCDWIDEYKLAVNWKGLFNETYDGDCGNGSCGYPDAHDAPKFHDLPYAFQQGIWIEFAQHILNEYFEQPEYEYCLDLVDNIELVLSELEKDILSDLDAMKELGLKPNADRQ